MNNDEVIEILIKKASDKRNWKKRKSAVEKLKKYHTDDTERMIVKLALYDPVFQVKKAAFLIAQSWNIRIDGEPIRLTKKKRGLLVKDIYIKLAKVKRNLNGNFTIGEFKRGFKKMYPKEYDIYDGNKGDKLDDFLKNCLNSLPKLKDNYQ